MGLGPAEAYQPPRRPSAVGVVIAVGSLIAFGLLLFVCGWAVAEVVAW